MLRHTDVMTRSVSAPALSNAGDIGLGGRMRASVVALAVVMCAASPAPSASSAKMAEPIEFLICQPGGPDLDDEQTAVMDRLFRHLEKKMDLTEGQLQGRYANTTKACDTALRNKPSIVFPSVPIYLEKRQALELLPIAQLRIDGQTRDHYYVMTKADADLTLADLAGKTLMGTHLDSPRFLTEGVFNGALKPDQLKLKPAKRALRGIRRVIRGKADAVILDGTQYRALKGSRYLGKLKLIHTSPELPTPPVTVVRSQVTADFGRRLGQALVGMSKDAEGQKVLKTFNIEGFEATSLGQWAKLEKRLSRL